MHTILGIFISTSVHVSGNYMPIIRRTYCIYATLVFFTLYWRLCGLQTTQPPIQSEKYQCGIDRVSSPDDGHIVARNMYRSWNKYTKNSVHLVSFISKRLYTDARSTKLKILFQGFVKTRVFDISFPPFLLCLKQTVWIILWTDPCQNDILYLQWYIYLTPASGLYVAPALRLPRLVSF